MLRVALSICLLFAWLGGATPTAAGAFLLPEGQGQFIAGIGYSAGSRRFDQAGAAVPTPGTRKLEASGYLEYGLTSRLTIIAAPTLAHATGNVAANTVTGSDSSALGARLQLFGTPAQVVAVQALVQPPIGDQSPAHQIATGGAGAFASDLRLLYGASFSLGGLPSFIDIEPGFRLHAPPLPTEARLDLTFGIHVRRSLMVLLQTFSAFAPASGTLLPRTDYTKAQTSLVYDVSPRWSVQLGGFRTLAGRDTLREMGPFGAAWYRF